MLAPFPPRADGAHGGSRAVAALVGGLAERNAVVLAVLRAADEPPTDATLCDRCELVREVPRPVTGRLRRSFGWLNGMPMWVSARSVAAYRECVRGLVRESRPDVIQVEYHAMGQYLDAAAGSPAIRVLTEHDPGIPAAREAVEAAAGAARLVCRADLRAWERFERRVLRGVDGVVVFTERDRAALQPVASPTPVVRIPLCTLPPGPALDPLGADPPSLAYVGNYLHAPNVDAAVRLATRIFPQVRARWPDARLYLVGRNPPAALLSLHGGPIVVTGEVPDVTPYLDRATVVVAPIRRGGGMRVKVLEALAAGKAVVASPVAVEGLDVTDGEQLLIAESDAEFAGAIHRLVAEPGVRAALAGRARTWAEQDRARCAPAVAYEQFYERLRAGETRR